MRHKEEQKIREVDELDPQAIPEEQEIPQTPVREVDELSPDAIPEAEYQHQKYGTIGQQARTAIEQGLSGATLGGSKVFQTKVLGTPSEEIEARAKENPAISIGSNIGGLATSTYLTGGLAPLLGVGANAARLAKIGVAGLEGAGIGGISEFTDQWSKDHPLDAQKIAAYAGLGGLLGAGTAGVIEGVKYKLGTRLASKGTKRAEEIVEQLKKREEPAIVSQLDAEKLAQGDFITAVEHSPNITEKEIPNIFAGLKKLKSNSNEIIQEADFIGAPVMEGMISDSVWIQKAEDALVNGRPSVSGIARQAKYQQGYDAVKNATALAVGEGSPHSKAELGNILKNSMVQRIRNQVSPIGPIYERIKQFTSIIPLSERSAPAIIRNIKGLQEVRLSPSSPQGVLANRVINDLKNVKTVDDVKAYVKIFRDSLPPTASSGEKRIRDIIVDKLNNLADRSIIRFANNPAFSPDIQAELRGLIARKAEADALYAPFRKNLNTLIEQLGKRRVYGAEDAINFVENQLTPEQITERLFSKRDSEFGKFFMDNFPNEMNLIRDYQKGIIREAASKAKSGFNPKQVFNEVNKLEKEIKNLIFSPYEQKLLKASEVVYKSFPDNFNPSGTERASALRAFMKSPHGAIVGNIADTGLLTFIKAGGAGVGTATSEALRENASRITTTIDKDVGNLFKDIIKK